MTPLEIDSHLSAFEIELKKLFHKQEGRTNLTPFQVKLVDRLRADESIVYALSDKGLGPVSVELSRYIKDTLKYLTKIIPEDQALKDADTLYDEIYEWTFEHRHFLSDSAVKFIRKKLKDAKPDPFG